MNNKAIVYIFCGLPFSGKTSTSKLVAGVLGIKRVAFDETWIEYEKSKGVIPGKDGVEQWRFINTLCETTVIEELKSGKSIVYDNLNNHKEHRDRVRDIAISAGANSKIIFLDFSKEEVIKRREKNLKTKERHQVSNENFNKALLDFEPPTKKENPIIISSFDNLKNNIIELLS